MPPPRVLDELEKFVAPHRTSWPELRWVRREHLHLTLAFLGDTDDRTLERLLPRLERAAGRYPKIGLSFAGGGAFPGGGAHARVLWSGVYGDRGTLVRMAASMHAGARRAAGTRQATQGPLADHKSFRPHLTLARCRRPMDVRPLLEQLSAYAGESWTADSVHLIRSHLPGKKSPQIRYETIKTWSLR